MDNSCNDKKDKNEEGGNEGDLNYQLVAYVKMSACDLAKGNISLADIWV